MRALRGVLTLMVLLAALGSVAGRADGRTSRHATVRPVTLRFTSQPGLSAVSNGEFTFLYPADFSGGTAGTLINERTGVSTAVPAAPGCANSESTPVIGPTWLLYQCVGEFDLYRLSTAGPYRQEPVNPRLTGFCDGMAACGPTAVGTDWIAFTASCYHCTPEYSFQSTTSQTQNLEGFSRLQAPDLSRPDLHRTVCRAAAPGPDGNVFTVGRLQLVYSPDEQTYSLARCGQPTRRRIGRHLGILRSPTALIAANRSVVLYEDASSNHILDGIRVNGDTPFQIRLPSEAVATLGFTGVGGLVLGNTHLYLNGVNGTLLTAALPDGGP